jgi:hypothetical protein
VKAVKSEEPLSFESFQRKLQDLTLSLFGNLSSRTKESVANQLLFKDVLSLAFASMVRLYARARLARVNDDENSGLNSLSLMRRERRIIGRLRESRGSTLTHAISAFRHGIESYLDNPMTVEYLGMAFETLYEAPPDLGSQVGVKPLNQHERRDRGVFFTPPEVVKFLTRTTLAPTLDDTKTLEQLLRIKVVDPALGAGFFLLESLRLLSEQFVKLDDCSCVAARTLVAQNCLYGVDIDSLATDIAKALLWLEVGDSNFSGRELDTHITDGDALLGLPPERILQRVKLPNSSKRDSSLMARQISRLGALHNSQVRSFANRIEPAISAQAFRPFSWELRFPEIFLDDQGRHLHDGGFDVVLSNPPWGKIKPEFKEFYAHLDDRVSQYQGPALRRYVNGDGRAFETEIVDKLYKQYASEVRLYSALLQTLGAYPNQRVELNGKNTRGDPDLYKYFMERSFQLSKPTGRIGLVVPAAFHRSEGAAGLRRLYLGQGGFESFLEFENRKNIFPIHSMFRFVLLNYKRGGRHGIHAARFGLTSVKDVKEIQVNGGVSISSRFLKTVSGDSLIVPELRSRLEQRLFQKLYECYPTLGTKSSTHWNVSFVRELDMTTDSRAFRDRAQLMRQKCRENDDGSWSSKNGITYLPLYEGRMVNQFDNAAKGYKCGQGRTAQWVPLSFTNKMIIPHYFVADSYIEKYDLLQTTARAGFCDVTGHANERTVLSALIPSGVPCGNKVPTLVFDNDDSRLHLIWLALANSFVIDWLVRRRISTTLNFFHWYSIPFPRIRPDSEVGKELSTAASKLCYMQIRQRIGTQNSNWTNQRALLKERAQLRADIDCIVAELFDLTLTEYMCILSDFQIIDRCQPPLNHKESSETRSTITRDKALSAFVHRNKTQVSREMLGLAGDAKNASDLHRRVVMAEANGAIAYVPSEHASIV